MKETWKSMTLSEKTEYLWMYYKIWFIGAALLAGAIWLGVVMYEGMNTKVLLNVAVTGGNPQNAELLEEAFCEYAGISKEDGIVRVQANIPEDGGGTSSKTLLTTLFGANAVDVLVCSEEVYEEYEAQNGLLRMDEVLGEDAAGYAGFSKGNAVLADSEGLLAEKLVSYEDIYVAVPVNCQNKEMAAAFVKYVLK